MSEPRLQETDVNLILLCLQHELSRVRSRLASKSNNLNQHEKLFEQDIQALIVKMTKIDFKSHNIFKA
jgi:hypothetical protein